MGYIGDEIGAHGFQTAKFSDHFIKVQKHPIQIIMPVRCMERWNIDRKITMSSSLKSMGFTI